MPNSLNATDKAAPCDAKLPISDDECLQRLAEVVQQHDAALRRPEPEPEPLDEVAALIGRLAVTIE